MNRGDILAFDSPKDEYKDWKLFRVINAITKENRTETSKETGAKMYLVGNVFTKKKKVEKAKELFIGDFFKMVEEGEARVGDESEAALIFLTNREF